MTRPKSQRTRWPPRSGLNLPRAVIAHQPQARFPLSMCGKVAVRGPKLNEAAANTPFTKLRGMLGSDMQIAASVSA